MTDQPERLPAPAEPPPTLPAGDASLLALVDRLAALGPVPGIDEPPRHRLGALVDVNLQALRHVAPLVLYRHHTPPAARA